MKRNALLEACATLIKEKVNDYFFKRQHRKTPKDFTRNRLLGFGAVILIMLNFKTKSNSLSTYNYMVEMENSESVSRQAYEAARDRVKSSAFRELHEDTVQMSLAVDDPITFCGFRVCPIDGTLVFMPKSEALARKYGPTTPVQGKTYARISLCVDVLNGVILDGEISAFSTGERKLAMMHIEKNLHPSLLYLFDRGYWDPKLIAAMCVRGQKFLVRLAKNSVPELIHRTEDSGNFVLKHKGKHKGKQYALRYYKFELPNGEMEYLATNVSPEEIPDSQLPALYALRWGIETKYDELKNRLQFEGFSGKSVNVIEQEFYASMVVMNLTGFAILAADGKVKAKREGKENRHEYKPNGNMAAGILKDRLLRAIIADDPEVRSKMLDKLVNDISKFVIPIKPNRHNPRSLTKAKHRRTRRILCPL